jgi:tetratricopeptide (TPR) repeat protein
MDNQMQNMEWIDKYLDGQLTAGESEAFEKMQQEDPSFKELVTDMKMLATGIRSSARDSLLQEIRDWEGRHQDANAQRTLNIRRRVRRIGWIPIAAAACLTVFLYIGVIRPPQSERIANSIYRNYYDGAYQYVIALTIRSDTKNKQANQDAFDAYDLDDYHKAIALFSQVPEKSDTVLFYLGNACLAVKDYEKAGECFRKTLETGRFMVDQARWYLALSLLKTRKMNEADSLLKELSGYRNFYQEKARKIVAELSTFQ